MLPPLPRCSGWAYSSLIAPSRVSLPRKGRRVGLHIVRIEITLPDGTSIRIGHDVSLATLRRVVTVLRG